MEHFIDENTYQFESEKELSAFSGMDLDTIDGDYAEAYQHTIKFWNSIRDKKFNLLDEK